MRALAAVVLVVAGSACSQRVYSPPTQAFALGPLHALAQDQRAVEVEVSSHAAIFDPSIHAGAGRLRTGVGDHTEVSVEGAVMNVAIDHPTPTSLYAGRVGIRTNPEGGDAAFFAGAGGGYAPAGGGFTALDGGLSLGIENCVLVPLVEGSGFVSQPLDPRPIGVSQDGDGATDTPGRTIGGSVRTGLRLSLSPRTCRRGEPAPWLYAGLGITWVADHDSSDALLGAGLGLTVPL